MQTNRYCSGSPGLGVDPGTGSIPHTLTLQVSESSHLCGGTTCYLQQLRMLSFICFGHRIGREGCTLFWNYVSVNVCREKATNLSRTKARFPHADGVKMSSRPVPGRQRYTTLIHHSGRPWLMRLPTPILLLKVINNKKIFWKAIIRWPPNVT